MRTGLLRLGAATLGALATMTVAAAATMPSSAAAPTTGRVALLVDGVGAACVDWHDGMSGADVLESAFTVEWSNPLLGARTPRRISKPGEPGQAPQRDWAYFHDTGSGWTAAPDSADTARPQPGTIEGWSATGAPPAPVTYRSICPPAPASARTPTAPTAPTASETALPTIPAPDARATDVTVIEDPAGQAPAAHPSGTTIAVAAPQPRTSPPATASWVGFTPTPTVAVPATAPPAIPAIPAAPAGDVVQNGPQPGVPAANTYAAGTRRAKASRSPVPAVLALLALLAVAGSGGVLALRNRRG